MKAAYAVWAAYHGPCQGAVVGESGMVPSWRLCNAMCKCMICIIDTRGAWGTCISLGIWEGKRGLGGFMVVYRNMSAFCIPTYRFQDIML